MALFRKHQFIAEVIKSDPPKDELIWKFPYENFNSKTVLIVSLSQEAIFVKAGQVIKIFSPGYYRLNMKNYPFIRSLVDFVTIAVPFFSCEVYFVDKNAALLINWKTDSPISMIDPIYHVPIGIRSRGTLSLLVENSQKLFEMVSAQIWDKNLHEINVYLSDIVNTNIGRIISDLLLTQGLSPIGIDVHLDKISIDAARQFQRIFDSYGISVDNCTVIEISTPDLDLIKQKALELRAQQMETEAAAEDRRKIAQLNTPGSSKHRLELPSERKPDNSIEVPDYPATVNRDFKKSMPYRGKDPYIFVSYAHKNFSDAIKIIENLQSSGYRVWFDEGIDPGTEWDENIAAHVEKCGYFIALLTQEYLRSSNCKDELNFARDLEKPRLLIYLENIQLPSGMKMRLNRLQAIHKYKYKTEEMFYEKLFAAQGIDTCQGD